MSGHIPSEETKLAVISTDIGYMKKSLENLERKIDDFTANYTLLKDFEPVRNKVNELERKMWLAMGGLSVITFALNYFK